MSRQLCADFQEEMREGRVADEARSSRPAISVDADRSAMRRRAGQICAAKVRPGFPTELRLPLTEPSEASRAAVDAALVHAGLI